jgi:hypothetical protein
MEQYVRGGRQWWGGNKRDDVNGSTCQDEGWKMSGIEMLRRACALLKSVCPCVVWSTCDVCFPNSMMAFIYATALTVGLTAKRTVARVRR